VWEGTAEKREYQQVWFLRRPSLRLATLTVHVFSVDSTFISGVEGKNQRQANPKNQKISG
jgi:hypothetical protein